MRKSTLISPIQTSIGRPLGRAESWVCRKRLWNSTCQETFRIWHPIFTSNCISPMASDSWFAYVECGNASSQWSCHLSIVDLFTRLLYFVSFRFWILWSSSEPLTFNCIKTVFCRRQMSAGLSTIRELIPGTPELLNYGREFYEICSDYHKSPVVGM